MAMAHLISRHNNTTRFPNHITLNLRENKLEICNMLKSCKCCITSDTWQ